MIAKKKKTVSADGDVTFDNLSVNRIQRTNEFINEYPFFATHEQTDSDFYKGMFGNELHRRYGADEPVYQLNLSATAPISIPSEKKTAAVFKDLCLSDPEFMTNASKSIESASAKMRRPSQQNIFNVAKKALNRQPEEWTQNDIKNLYAAFNMSLVHHEDFNNNAQDAFYSALKANGYSGIRDLNDSRYSSYHAKDPIILFDTDKFILQSVTGVSNEEIEEIRNSVLSKYAMKDMVYNIASLPEQAMNTTISNVQEIITNKVKANVVTEE